MAIVVQSERECIYGIERNDMIGPGTYEAKS